MLSAAETQILDGVRRGLSIEDAAVAADRQPSTVRRWLAEGRRDTYSGPRGTFALRVDLARDCAYELKDRRSALARRRARHFALAVARYFEDPSETNGKAMRQSLDGVNVSDVALALAMTMFVMAGSDDRRERLEREFDTQELLAVLRDDGPMTRDEWEELLEHDRGLEAR